MRRTKRWLATLLSALLLLSLLSVTALAADDWADSAVSTLETVYDGADFSDAFVSGDMYDAEDGLMEKTNVDAFLTAIQAEEVTVQDSDFVGGAPDTGALRRDGAARILVEAYRLDIKDGGTPTAAEAIDFLYQQHIINGFEGSNELGGNRTLTQAEFAVLAYRVLNFVGGGAGSEVELVPGTKEYFSWMYLAARLCPGVAFERAVIEAAKTAPFDVGIWEGEDVEQEVEGEMTTVHQKGWRERLVELRETNLDKADAAIGDIGELDRDAMVLDAAVAVVEALGAKSIFSDVKPNSPYYDGVMYLFDRGIVKGTGEGKFTPEVLLPRADFVALLSRFTANPFVYDYDSPAGKSYYEAAKDYLVGHQTDLGLDWSEYTADDLRASVNRKDAIVGILTVQDKGKAAAAANPAILDRFSDVSDVTGTDRTYLAYAVSRGLVNGTADGRLNPDGEVSRGELGVLLYRALLDVDATKMKDYGDNVKFVLEGLSEPGGIEP